MNTFRMGCQVLPGFEVTSNPRTSGLCEPASIDAITLATGNIFLKPLGRGRRYTVCNYRLPKGRFGVPKHFPIP